MMLCTIHLTLARYDAQYLYDYEELSVLNHCDVKIGMTEEMGEIFSLRYL